MKTQKPRVVDVRLSVPDGFGTAAEAIEHYARICYRSEAAGADSGKFVKSLIRRGHLSMLEFVQCTAVFECDRGMSHELVRHRAATYAQESTRYVDLVAGKHGGEITVIEQPGIEPGTPEYEVWAVAMERAEASYRGLRLLGVSPEIARSVLPIGVKTRIAISADLREWLHIFGLRTSDKAHPIIRSCISSARDIVANLVPAIKEAAYPADYSPDSPRIRVEDL